MSTDSHLKISVPEYGTPMNVTLSEATLDTIIDALYTKIPSMSVEQVMSRTDENPINIIAVLSMMAREGGTLTIVPF